MSRSFKKYPISKDNARSSHNNKRIAARRFRRKIKHEDTILAEKCL